MYQALYRKWRPKTFDEVESAFAEVQKITRCSTGCGGCHDEIMDTISEIMHQ